MSVKSTGMQSRESSQGMTLECESSALEIYIKEESCSMADKKQLQVNRIIRKYNKSFLRDADPYNRYRLKQVRRSGFRDNGYSFWEISLLKDNEQAI